MKACRFRLGDQVDIDPVAVAGIKTTPEVNLLRIIFAAQSLQRWRVIFADYNSEIGTWEVWVESRAGDVHRFEERHLNDRAENFKQTWASIRFGENAREILGRRKLTTKDRSASFKKESEGRGGRS